MTLDKGTSGASALGTFDGYHGGSAALAYRDFGFPKDSSGALLQLAKGVHTLTVTVTGKNASSAGYQLGIGDLRLAPTTANCAINNLTACLGNTAISVDTATPFSAADADGYGTALSSTDLAAAGWTPGATINVDGAPMTVPSYGAGKADNIVAGGQLVTVPGSGVADDGNAVVFLGFAANGAVSGATGTITYAASCNGSSTQPYSIDTMPDWTSGSAVNSSFHLSRRVNAANSTYDTTKAPQMFAVSVPLLCPGQALASISLPVVSNGVVAGVPAMHILGLGIRASSFTTPANSQMWTGSFGAKQDSVEGSWTTQTLRMPVRLTMGDSAAGGQVRIHLSNALGTTPATFTAVTVAPQDTTAGGAAAAAAPTPVLFGGQAGVVIPAGGSAVSDPVTASFADESTVLVSVALSGTVAHVPAHDSAQSTSYATAGGSGDHTGETAATNFTVTMGFQPYLTGIDVTTTGNTAGTLVMLGDHTVNSDSASGDGTRLSDAIAAQLAAANGDVVPYGVLNEGKNNWVTTNNLLPPVADSATPANAIGPAEQAVLAQTNARTVLISTGTDDVLAGSGYTAIENQLIALSSQIRHYYTDAATDYSVNLNNAQALITVYVATIPPDARFTAAEETVRETVNNYILCGVNSPAAGTCSSGITSSHLGGNSDGAIDFAAAVSSDGTDTGSTVAAAKLYNSNPDNSYYAALAAEYIQDSANTNDIHPMIARRLY